MIPLCSLFDCTMTIQNAHQLKGKTGLRRLINATRYSRDGIVAAFKNEAAFRQEAVCCLFLIPSAFVLPVETIYQLAAIGSLFLLLIVELLNSGIEAAIDRIGPELHEKSKFAKDVGSAAVLFALIHAIVVWVCILLQAFVL